MIDIRQLPYLNQDQKEFTNRFYSQFGHRITNVEQLNYQGIIGATEYLIYAPTKLYFCFDINISCSVAINQDQGSVLFYNENNVINMVSQYQEICFNTVANQIWTEKNYFINKNIWFSRIIATQYNFMKINGYRITII